MEEVSKTANNLEWLEDQSGYILENFLPNSDAERFPKTSSYSQGQWSKIVESREKAKGKCKGLGSKGIWAKRSLIDQDLSEALGLNYAENLSPMEIIKETQQCLSALASPAHKSPMPNNTRPLNWKWKQIARTLGHNDNDIPNSRKQLATTLTEGFSSEQKKKL